MPIKKLFGRPRISPTLKAFILSLDPSIAYGTVIDFNLAITTIEGYQCADHQHKQPNVQNVGAVSPFHLGFPPGHKTMNRTNGDVYEKQPCWQEEEERGEQYIESKTDEHTCKPGILGKVERLLPPLRDQRGYNRQTGQHKDENHGKLQGSKETVKSSKKTFLGVV